MLQRPWMIPCVAAFWLLANGWLFVAKILPGMRTGAPPGQQALYASGDALVPIGWTVSWNERPLGWALTESARNDEGGMEVKSWLHFDHVPLDEMVPAWVGNLIRTVADAGGPRRFDAEGRLAIDPAGRLRTFRSAVVLPGAAAPIILEGTVDDGQVAMVVTAGDLRYDTTRTFPPDVSLGDELSPQATLPGLYEGRRWKVPIYSPLRPGQAAIDVLHAEVGPEEAMFWENRLVRVRIVTYRDDPTSSREPRCRMWVDLDGRVLRQDALLLGSALSFLRRSDEAALRLLEEVAKPLASGRAPGTRVVPAEETR